LPSDDARTTTTQLLEGVRGGDRAALDALVTILYGELRGMAHRQRRRWQGDHTLGTTALVHEAYLKLSRQKRLSTGSRAHFLALSARAMRHILSNYAEERRTQKRGGGGAPVSLTEAQLPARAEGGEDETLEALATLHRALERLEASYPRSCRVVECRFFGGLSVEETASALGTSPRTVKRDWAYAQAWLNRELDRNS
jgi:RNA polymerase sigma factor (TIGR02999 family)